MFFGGLLYYFTEKLNYVFPRFNIIMVHDNYTK